MDKESLSIATITLARDKQEEKLLTESLVELAKLDIPVFITDGGSPASFLDFIQSFANFVLNTESVRGVWPQTRHSLSAAWSHGSKFIFYTEPDKIDFFSRLPHWIDQLQLDKKTGIAIASRSATGFATFPEFQQMTEKTLNKACAEIIGKEVDYTYGPFLINRQLIPYLHHIQRDIGWGWRSYAFTIAHRLEYGVEAFVADFSCPTEQQQDDRHERIHRMKQLSQQIDGIVLAAGASLNEIASTTNLAKLHP